MKLRVNLLRLTILVLAMVTVSGCQWYKTVTFSANELSGKTEGVKFDLVYYRDGVPQTVGNKSEVSLATSVASKTVMNSEAQESLKKRLFSSCNVGDNKEFGPVAAIPLLATAGKLAFDAGADYLAERIKEMQEKAKATYAARLVMDSKPFDLTAKDTKECLVAYRYRSIGKETEVKHVPGMIMIFQLHKLTHTFYLVPTYLWVGDSVAQTASKDPKIDLSVAIAARVAESNQAKITMKSVVETTFKFSISSLGNGAAIDCTIPTCKMFSELATPVTGDAKGAMISLAVVETGSHASTLDKAQAELQAFKTAVGPAAKEALTKELTP